MKSSAGLLKEACALLAQEETEKLIQSLDEDTLEKADALFKRHRKSVFSLLAGHKKTGAMPPWLRAAACIALILGGVWLALSQHSPDPVPLAPVYTASVAPYYSPVPTCSPVPTDFITPSPTFSPVPSHTPTISPTNSPLPTQSPTLPPTSSPAPAATPSPAPTFTPLPTQSPDIAAVPEGWSGQYFPQVPSRYVLISLEHEEQMLRATYEAPNGNTFRFEEYPPKTSISIPESAKVSYVRVNEYVALQMIMDDTVTLCWEAEGSTLALTAPAAEALSLAESVKNILIP